MTAHCASRLFAVALLLAPLAARAAEPDAADLARKAQAILKANCYRCHGQEGAVEGGMNYILDLERLVLRKKVVPGQPDKSPLYKKLVNNLMPPPDEQPRLSEADRALLKQWIESGAPKLPSGPEMISPVSGLYTFTRPLAPAPTTISTLPSPVKSAAPTGV